VDTFGSLSSSIAKIRPPTILGHGRGFRRAAEAIHPLTAHGSLRFLYYPIDQSSFRDIAQLIY
jgi:hypothetical protein